MLRRHHRFFQSLQVLRDAALVGLAFFAAYYVRFYSGLVFPAPAPVPPRETSAIALLVLAVWPAVGWFGGLYVSYRARGILAEIFEVFRVSLIAFLVLVTVTYFVRDVRYSRATLLLWTVFSFAAVSGVRVLSRIALRRLRSRGYNLRHVLVVGVGELAAQVVRTIEQQVFLGMRVVGMIAHDDDAAAVGGHVGRAPILGTVSRLRAILAQRQIDQVIVALPIDKLSGLKGLMRLLSQETVDVRLIPDVYQYVTLCGSIEELSGLPIITLQSTPLLGWNRVAKRAFDILAAGFGLVVMAPLMAMIAVWVRATSPGPVFFRQERVGMDGRRFMMLKFRTMRTDAATSDTGWTVENDPRRTPVGRTLRRYSLDELPQLWNVLLGDMSLVGPRPEQPRFTEIFKKDIPRYALRHKIKAGMTGWAQVNGMRGNTSVAKRIELDLYYIENWSLLLDLKILLRTVFGGFLSPNAY